MESRSIAGRRLPVFSRWKCQCLLEAPHSLWRIGQDDLPPAKRLKNHPAACRVSHIWLVHQSQGTLEIVHCHLEGVDAGRLLSGLDQIVEGAVTAVAQFIVKNQGFDMWRKS